MSKVNIVKVCGREVLDSRGNPTVEALVTVEKVCLTRYAISIKKFAQRL